MISAIRRLGPGVVLALLGVYIFWGGTYLAIRVAVESIPPLLMAAVRFLIAGTMMYMFLRLRGAPAPSRRQWGAAAIGGVLLLVGGNGGVVLGQHWGVASGMAALGVAAVPLWVSLLSALLGNAPNRIEWAGVAIGFAGVAMLNLDGEFISSPLAAAMILLAGLSWAVGTVWSRHLPLPQGMMASATQMLTASVVFALISLFSGEHLAAIPSARSLIGLAYLVVGGAILGFSAFVYLNQRVRPALATSYSYVNPVIAVLLGAIFAGEQLSPMAFGAMAVIVAGVALVVIARDRSAPAPRRETSYAEGVTSKP